MKKVSLWLSKILVLVAMLAISGQVAAQEIEPGYYYINNAVKIRYLMDNVDVPRADWAWRIRYKEGYEPNMLPQEDDKIYIWKVTKQSDDTYNFMNVNSGKFFGRDDKQGAGAGLGAMSKPAKYVIEYNEDRGQYAIRGVEQATDRDFYVMTWDDGYASYCYDSQFAAVGDGNKWWNFTKIDDALVEDMKPIETVEGSLEDGYYTISLPYVEAGDVYLCAAPDDDMRTRLQADLLDDTENIDATFVFHIKKQENGNYSVKNCGRQPGSYIQPYAFGNYATTTILMTADATAEQKLEFLSNGTAVMFPAGNDNCYHFKQSNGSIIIASAKDAGSMLKFNRIADDKVTNEIKLNEVITEYNGEGYEEGEEPGQVAKEAIDEYNAAIAEAVAAAGSDLEGAIAKVKAASEKINAAVVKLEDGYYRFWGVNTQDYLVPNFANNNGEETWWLSHKEIDITDAASYWRLTRNEDGTYVMKNGGSQDMTYFMPAAKGENWGHVRMSGTAGSTMTFKHIAGNKWQLFNSENAFPFVQGNSNLITTNKDYMVSAFWLINKVDMADVDPLAVLGEAISDAAGVAADYDLGTDPGQYTGDATALNLKLEAARTMYEDGLATPDAIKAMIEELKEAADEFAAQEHVMVPMQEGYYYFVNAGRKTELNGVFTENGAYTTPYGAFKWANLDEESPAFLFKAIDNGDGTFMLQNVMYGTYVGSYQNANYAVMMTDEPTVGHKFTLLDRKQWNIANVVDPEAYELYVFNKDQPSFPIRCKNGGINSKSAWYLRRVMDQELIDRLVAEGKQMGITQNLRNALAKAEPAYKGTFKINVDDREGHGLIKVVNDDNPLEGQLWGTEQGTANYSSYANLIDGSHNSCFQSSWDAASASEQWLQVDLKDEPVKDFQFYFGLRDEIWGYAEQWTDVTLYATNNAELASEYTTDYEQWTKVGRYDDFDNSFDRDGKNRGFRYTITGIDQPYRFYRFLVNSTLEPQNNMMFTIGEFQMYKAEIDEENSYYNYVPGMKDLKDKLEVLIADARNKVTSNTATQEDIDKLVAATEEMYALIPDITPLENYIDEVQNYVSKFGDEDKWGDVTPEEYEAMTNAIMEAGDFNHDAPIRSELDAKIADLEKAFNLFKSQQKQVETNKWYFICNTDQTRNGTDNPVYGNMMMSGGSNNSIESGFYNVNADPVRWGGYHDGERDAAAESDPNFMWRLIEVSEPGAEQKLYAIQNRINGLCIQPTNKQGERMGMKQDPTTSAFRLELVASGQYRIISNNPDNVNKFPIHAAGDGYLCNYHGGADSPSAWTFDEVYEEEDALHMTIADNCIQILSFPYEIDENVVKINNNDGVMLYGIKGVSEDNTELYLKKLTSVAAGEAFVVIPNDYTAYDPTNVQGISLYLPYANEYNFEGKTVNGLVAVIDCTVPGVAGYGIFFQNQAKSTKATTTLYGHCGYINPNLIVNEEGEPDLTLTLGEGVLNGINNVVVAQPAANVNVYTIDGVLVKKNVARSNATNGLAKGIYIVGKEKVLVK